jgi:eukaryotic-like serine/threonine-protein kinase
MAIGPKVLYEFGPFQVDPDKQVLLRENQQISVTPKAFETLLILIRHSRELVSKEDLMSTLWPDAFVEEANLSQNIFMLRKALGDTPEERRYIVTLPGRGYRFAAQVRTVTQVGEDLIIESRSRSELVLEHPEGEILPALSASQHRKVIWKHVLPIGVVFVSLIAGTAAFVHKRRPIALGERDSVLVADFMNTTGDAVFDGALRQGLEVQLEQSPFVNLVSDERIRQTLRLMSQPTDARLTPEIAYDLCQRIQSAVVIDGSIASLGSQYVLGLKAVNCRTGDSLAQEQVRVTGKEQVLAAMDKATVKLREKLGESPNTLERFDTPLEQATTPSFEALQAYSLGRKTMVGKAEFAAALPFFQRAVQFDPNFAMAYAALGSDYWTLGETRLGAENVRKAYELRAQVSEREKFYIESTYYHYVTGDLGKARQVYELSAQTYPRYAGTPLRLWVLYTHLGQYDNALTQIREAVRLDPSRAVNYSDLVQNYIDLNQFEEARATAQEVQAKQLDSTFLRLQLYQLSFLRNDAAGMAEQVEWASGKAGTEDMLLGLEADSAAYFGELTKSRDFSRRAMASAIQAERKKIAADYEVRAALREALYGNMTETRLRANSALRSSAPKDAQYGAALALAFAGDTFRVQLLADDLAKRFPDDTIVHCNYLPTVHAQLALSHGQASKAIEVLQAAAPYELGAPGNVAFSPSLYPIYLRGNAYLAARQGSAAATEFQKILDHRGIVANKPIGALAHLQLGRAFAMSGETSKAKSAYEDFLTLWKDADPDIPILKQARAEYAKLQ